MTKNFLSRPQSLKLCSYVKRKYPACNMSVAEFAAQAAADLKFTVTPSNIHGVMRDFGIKSNIVVERERLAEYRASMVAAAAERAAEKAAESAAAQAEDVDLTGAPTLLDMVNTLDSVVVKLHKRIDDADRAALNQANDIQATLANVGRNHVRLETMIIEVRNAVAEIRRMTPTDSQIGELRERISRLERLYAPPAWGTTPSLVPPYVVTCEAQK